MSEDNTWPIVYVKGGKMKNEIDKLTLSWRGGSCFMIAMIDLIIWTNTISSSPNDAASLFEDSEIRITSKRLLDIKLWIYRSVPEVICWNNNNYQTKPETIALPSMCWQHQGVFVHINQLQPQYQKQTSYLDL